MDTTQARTPPSMCDRFRGFLPVVVDVETGGFNPHTDALLEVAACIIRMDNHGVVYAEAPISVHVEPFAGAHIDPKALEVTGIDPDSPLRAAQPEKDALDVIFQPVRKAVRDANCQRAVLVGHNATFDLSFMAAAVRRTGYKRNPLHPFTCFDTATLGGLAYGQTVLSKAVQAAGLDFNAREAHSAVYDTERTAQLFCAIVNRWKHLQELELERMGDSCI